MRVLCVFGRHNYGDPARGEGVEYARFLPALRALGHEVEVFESFSRAAHASFAELNRALLERFEAYRPQVVFTVLMMAEVWLETIALMRAAGARVVNWSTDDSWKYAQFARLIAAGFDRFATTWPEAPAWYARDGIRGAVLTQWAAASGELAAPKPAAKCGLDVVFVGSNYGERERRIERLRAGGVAVRCFGHGWPGGPVDARRMNEIVRDARVTLNFSEAGGGGAGRQIKARVFEVPGAGGMLLTQDTPHLADYLVPGREVMVFSDDESLIAAARRLLATPEERDAIARAGHARVAAEHVYERRMEVLLDSDGPPAAARPIDWGAFEAAARRHRVGPALRALRAALVFACTMVWGRARGARAARRALFEASWRLAGRHTYTAAGWPGRLFYRES